MNFEWTAREQTFATKSDRSSRANCLLIGTLLRATGPARRTDRVLPHLLPANLAEAGLLVPHWPKEYGGRGSSVWEHFILGEEMWAVGEPRGPQYMNVNWIGPTIAPLRHGCAEGRATSLKSLRAGAVWCQGFSEPSAGSDLASLRTRADREGDTFRHQRLEDVDLLCRRSPITASCWRGLRQPQGGHLHLPDLDADLGHHGAADCQPSSATATCTRYSSRTFVVPASSMLGEEGQAWS